MIMNFEYNLLFLLMVIIYLDTTKHHQLLLAPATAAVLQYFPRNKGTHFLCTSRSDLSV